MNSIVNIRIFKDKLIIEKIDNLEKIEIDIYSIVNPIYILPGDKIENSEIDLLFNDFKYMVLGLKFNSYLFIVIIDNIYNKCCFCQKIFCYNIKKIIKIYKYIFIFMYYNKTFLINIDVYGLKIREVL